jgi:hypothetical protein
MPRKYPGMAMRFLSHGAHCLKTSSENPPLSMPGVAKRTHGPGAFIIERSKGHTVSFYIVTLNA